MNAILATILAQTNTPPLPTGHSATWSITLDAALTGLAIGIVGCIVLWRKNKKPPTV
jgi:hypothetical protein